MSDYQVLSQEEQDDIIVSFMHGQERDKYCHEISIQRYNTMLNTLEEGEWRKRIQKLHDDTVSRLAEIDSIIGATKAQMPPPKQIKAAQERILTQRPADV